MTEKIICTKADEFQSVPCNCPECVEEREGKELAFDEPVVLTDEDILEEGKLDKWVGPVFKCPSCGAAGIMPPAKGCIYCLKPVVYKSKILTDMIKQIQGNSTAPAE